MSNAVLNVTSSCGGKTRQQRFLVFLPSIQDQARYAFLGLPSDMEEEMVQEVVANAWQAFARLCDHGKQDIAYPTPLAQYAIKQVRDGRRTGSSRNANDVTSEYGQRVNGHHVESLSQQDAENGEWREMVVIDKRATPADMAATRIDFSNWLGMLSTRKRQIAELLASGETTADAAEKSGMTPGRVSQIRKELAQAWHQFQADGSEPATGAAVG